MRTLLQTLERGGNVSRCRWKSMLFVSYILSALGSVRIDSRTDSILRKSVRSSRSSRMMTSGCTLIFQANCSIDHTTSRRPIEATRSAASIFRRPQRPRGWSEDELCQVSILEATLARIQDANRTVSVENLKSSRSWLVYSRVQMSS